MPTPQAVCFAFLAALAPPAAAQTLQLLIQEGDLVPGAGAADFFYDLAVDDAGGWLVQVDVGPGFGPMAVVGSGGLHALQGQALPAWPGAQLGVPIDLARAVVDDVLLLTAVTTPPGLQTEALLLDLTPQLVVGEPVLAAGLPPGALLTDLWRLELGRNGHLLVQASVQAPGGAEFVALLGYDVVGGALSNAHVVAAAGDVPPGETAALASFGRARRSGDGRTILAATLAAPLGQSHDERVLLDGLALAIEGRASPVPGRVWADTLSTAWVDANPSGDHVLCARLSGDPATRELVARNGAKLAQTGDRAPASPAHRLQTLSPSPFFARDNVQVDAAGRVLWAGSWDAPAPANAALHRDLEPVVRVGVDTLGAKTVGAIVPETWRASPNGRYLIFHCALLQGGQLPKRGVVRVDLGP